MSYTPESGRYDGRMQYVRCGNSGLKLPAVSLGLWQNFGGVNVPENAAKMVHVAFDLGITHFDLANLYGPPPGSAEKIFADILHRDLARYRDELVISTKAGSLMHEGPYGSGGSRKTLIAGCEASLKRLRLDYVGAVLLTSERDDVTSADMVKEFQIELWDEYYKRSVDNRNRYVEK